MIIILFYMALSSFSQAGRWEGGEPGAIRRSCDEQAVSECRARAEIAVRECRERAAAYSSQENIVLTDLNSRRENLAATQAAVLSVDLQSRAAASELQFLDDLEKNSGQIDEIFPGSPSLEIFFSLDQLSREWNERYPAQYRLKLKDQESELAISRQKFSLRQSEIESEINSMLPMQSFLSGEKNRWLNDASTHAYRWEKGCRQQVCPGN